MIERHPDPTEYARLVTPFLMRDEPRFNLELAIVGRLAAGDSWSDRPPVLLTVDGAPVVMTPPHNILVSALPTEAAPAVADWVAANGFHDVPGALGPVETATAFAERYAALTGRPWHVSRDEGVYVLRTLVPPRPAPGALRLATRDDTDVVVAWGEAFQAEAHLPPIDLGRFAARIDDRMIWLWHDDGPVSMVGCGGFTPTGARIGPVYTPPDRRGRGYASAATAGVTQALLDTGRTCTFLYTDLANPTSNKIYRAIGYEHVTDVREVSFRTAAPENLRVRDRPGDYLSNPSPPEER